MFQFIEISKEYCYLITNWFTKFFDSIMRKDPIVFYLFNFFFNLHTLIINRTQTQIK